MHILVAVIAIMRRLVPYHLENNHRVFQDRLLANLKPLLFDDSLKILRHPMLGRLFLGWRLNAAAVEDRRAIDAPKDTFMILFEGCSNCEGWTFAVHNLGVL